MIKLIRSSRAKRMSILKNKKFYIYKAILQVLNKLISPNSTLSNFIKINFKSKISFKISKIVNKTSKKPNFKLK